METVIAKQNILRLRLNYYLTRSLLVTADFIAVCLAVYIGLLLRSFVLGFFSLETAALAVPGTYLYLALPTFYVSAIACAGLYERRLLFYQWAQSFFKITTCLCAASIVTAYLLGNAAAISRLFVALFWFSSFLSLCVLRYGIKQLLLCLGIWQRPVIIVGAGKTAELLANSFERDSGVGYKIVGLIEDDRSRPLLKRYPYLGKFQQAEALIQNANIKDVILATPGLKRKELVSLFYRIQPYVRNLSIVPDVFGVPIGNSQIETLFSERTLLVNTSNNLNRRSNRILKRIFDIVIGTLLCFPIIPLLAILGIWIKMDSTGPVFHIAERIGKGGRNFACYKFRSMYQNADEILRNFLEENPERKTEWETYAKLRKEDPRVTRSGKWLRKYSLDELPQLINVLKGEMSLVGPRPYLPREKGKIGKYLPVISMTVPGITGLWQVSGRNEVAFHGRLQMDAWYVRNWNLWQDIVLLLKTIRVVLNKNGAY